MTLKEKMTDILSREDFGNTDKILTCLLYDDNKPKQIKDIKEIGKRYGIRKIDKWNISHYLGKDKSLAVKVPTGWKLTQKGSEFIQAKIGPIISPRISKATASIYKALDSIGKPETKTFITESVGCFERKYFRASVVLSWSGAISLLHEHVVSSCLLQFNNEAKKRNPKWKDAKNTDDLGRMREFDFLNILESISVIGKNLKQELEVCLKLRNACGHPNSLVIAEARVLAHLEILTLNIYIKF